MDLGILDNIIWFGCFLVVTVDSAFRVVRLVFWFVVALVSGPFILLACRLMWEKGSNR